VSARLTEGQIDAPAAQHGVFAIGRGPRDAVKSAVMCEDAARTVHLARVLGTPQEISPENVDRLHWRYTHEYGQR
jgi:L-ribulose-5-phosphate 4-epimerase